MKLKSHQQMRNFDKNLDGNSDSDKNGKNLDGNRNSDKSHLGLKMLHPRVQQSNTDKKGTDEPCELWRSSNPYIIWGRRPAIKDHPKIILERKEKVAYKGITVYLFIFFLISLGNSKSL